MVLRSELQTPATLTWS